MRKQSTLRPRRGRESPSSSSWSASAGNRSCGWTANAMSDKCDSLSAPHEYDLGILPPGTHTADLAHRQPETAGSRLQHARLPRASPARSTTASSAAIELRPSLSVFVRANQVYADPGNGALRTCASPLPTGPARPPNACCDRRNPPHGRAAAIGFAARRTVTLPPGESEVQLARAGAARVPCESWSEFERPLYAAQVGAKTEHGMDGSTKRRFGFRTLRSQAARSSSSTASRFCCAARPTTRSSR